MSAVEPDAAVSSEAPAEVGDAEEMPKDESVVEVDDEGVPLPPCATMTIFDEPIFKSVGQKENSAPDSVPEETGKEEIEAAPPVEAAPVTKERWALIGWVAKLRETNGAPDASDEYHEILEEVKSGTHEIASHWDLIYLIIPGLFCLNWKDSYMNFMIKHLHSLGLDSRMAMIDTGKGVVDNALKISEIICELHEQTGKRCVMLCHSKGSCDAVAAVARYTDKLRGKVAGIVSLNGPLGGTPVADGLFDVRLYRGIAIRVIRHLLGGEKHAVRDLRHDLRKTETEQYPYPYDEFPIVTCSSGTHSYHSVLAVLAQLFRKQFSHTVNDGIVLSVDADLPLSTRVYHKFEWNHTNPAYEQRAAEKAAFVNEAALTLLLRRLGKVQKDA